MSPGIGPFAYLETEMPNQCPYCGDHMANVRRKQCGKPECRRAFDAERARAWHRNYTATTGERYGSKYREREVEYYRRRYQEQPHWRERYPVAAAASDARRRMLVQQAGKDEAFAPLDVHTRDGWTCRLCRRPIDPEVAWPDPMSASVDHIVPLSRGGEHSMINVQSAHLGCNSSKGDRLAGELAATRERSRL